MSLKVDTRQSFDCFKHAGMYSNTVSLYTYILECPLEHSYMAIIVLCNKWISVLCVHEAFGNPATSLYMHLLYCARVHVAIISLLCIWMP